jgi:hypothetical protein
MKPIKDKNLPISIAPTLTDNAHLYFSFKN